MIKVGDRVRVVSTPYYSVPNGTVAEVLDIWEGFFVGEGQGSDINCYVLKGLPNRLFRGHKIEEVGDE